MRTQHGARHIMISKYSNSHPLQSILSIYFGKQRTWAHWPYGCMHLIRLHYYYYYSKKTAKLHHSVNRWKRGDELKWTIKNPMFFKYAFTLTINCLCPKFSASDDRYIANASQKKFQSQQLFSINKVIYSNVSSYLPNCSSAFVFVFIIAGVVTCIHITW